MIRPIFFTTSCARDRQNGLQDAVKRTWLVSWGHLIEHRFILGYGNENPDRGELIVDYEDSYAAITGKNLEAYRWAAEQGYTHAFVGDTDTYVNVPEMLASGFENHDYTGRACDEGHAGQGCGFFMSRRAFTECFLGITNPMGHPYFDMMCGLHLRDACGIPLHHDPRYYFSPHVIPTRQEWDEVKPVTVNLGRETGKYFPETTHQCHVSNLSV